MVDVQTASSIQLQQGRRLEYQQNHHHKTGNPYLLSKIISSFVTRITSINKEIQKNITHTLSISSNIFYIMSYFLRSESSASIFFSDWNRISLMVRYYCVQAKYACFCFMEQGRLLLIMKVAILSPIAWRTPPRHYGPWDKSCSLLAEGLVKEKCRCNPFCNWRLIQ